MTAAATADRRARVAASLPEGLDALLVTNLVNVRYLSGFTGSNGALLLTRAGDATFATDGRYVTQAAAEVPDLEVLETRAVGPALVEAAGRQGVRRLGIETEHVTVAVQARLAAVDGAPELVACRPVVEPLRAAKDEAELAALTQACAITDAAFATAVASLRPGVTERDVAWTLQSAMHDHGAEAPAFDSIVAFGGHSAIPHHQPTDRPLRPGDLVKLDFGARYAGYHADMTRTVAVAPVADWQRDLHALVHDIQQRCRDRTVHGAAPAALDSYARELITDAGHQPAHGLGHGVGLEIHESPFLTPGSAADTLADRVPVTVEPGVYLPGRGGVRIEDTVVVRLAATECLTASTRDLIEIS
ncbi:MAG TPA: Xaa-Pro peptidase family protein [Mycobacteriales bacterium]|nr:Xaa-Pro peptidase family protein [Mycobacteriales bacterium]